MELVTKSQQAPRDSSQENAQAQRFARECPRAVPALCPVRQTHRGTEKMGVSGNAAAEPTAFLSLPVNYE